MGNLLGRRQGYLSLGLVSLKGEHLDPAAQDSSVLKDPDVLELGLACLEQYFSSGEVAVERAGPGQVECAPVKAGRAQD